MVKIVVFPYGRLGNIMFELMCCYNICKKNCHEFYIYLEYYEKHNVDYFDYTKLKKFLKNCFNIKFIKDNCELNEYDIFEEHCFKYSKIPNFFKNTQIHGNFQSWKYFYENIDSLREIFQSGNTMNEVYESVSEGKKTVCLHIRRGDYLRLREYHTVIDEDYYENSTNRFTDDEVFLVFAEDYEDDFMNWKLWSKLGKRVKFMKDSIEALQTFFLMSLCDNFIIANSTLSLCAYYFRYKNPSVLIYPEKWFGPKGPEFDINELISTI